MQPFTMQASVMLLGAYGGSIVVLVLLKKEQLGEGGAELVQMKFNAG